MDDPRAAYARRVERAAASLRAPGTGPPVGLVKPTSNLFRDRVRSVKRPLDLRDLDHVIQVDDAARWVDAEALVTYEALADATLAHRSMPAVVPQLKTITAGGAVAGVGIEATSFRQGLVHDTLLEADVLLAGGDVVTCTPSNDHAALFHALPNSYGTLGYLLRVRLRTLPVRPFVRVRHERFGDAQAFFGAILRTFDEAEVDFADAVAFGARDLVLTRATFAAAAPYTSDYKGLEIYHRSLRARPEDWLTVRDWLWRWDTDWFWCSRRFGLERRWLRRLLGPARLNSRHYTRWMRWAARTSMFERWARWRGARHVESVIQDVDIPLERAGEFLDFLLAEVGIVPIWICPIGVPAALPATLYPLRPGARYVNFGFWDTLVRPESMPAGHFNRRIEGRVLALGGLKSLYSDSTFDHATFDAAYGMADYAALKSRYDPQGRLLGLYEKCVLRR